ncbi:uncharacterized protein [Panulirus ornatus]|uniref:uncharacterized protein n=1 Tax=Panulirus ornatus TaxID=150431 RepID=UPI003A88AC7A
MDDVNPAGHAADEGRHPDQAVQLQQQQQVIRSLRSRQRSYVRFVNRTQRTVDVIWLDYNGVRQKYKTLIPGEAFKVNTFVTHPWIFRDAETTATLLVNSEEVFYPKVEEKQCEVSDVENTVMVHFTPTIPHCSMASLIGLSIRLKLLQALPPRFKVDVRITPGTHASEHAINKQLNDKERVAAALENPHLLEVINKCLNSRGQA